jgi:hypothetical protein
MRFFSALDARSFINASLIVIRVSQVERRAVS